MKRIYSIICLAFCLVVTSGHAADPEGQRYGPVQEKETLFRIALKFRQPGITVAQLMMSIFEANPEAFHRSNINRLKVGVILLIPPPESIAGLDRKQALRDATGQIDTFESEVRESRVEAGEIEPLADAPRGLDDQHVVAKVVCTPQRSEGLRL